MNPKTSRRSNRKFTIAKAVKHQLMLKLLLSGPAGSGKTWCALAMAEYIVQNLPDDHNTNGRICLLDTEANSASLYADRYDFDVLVMEPPFDPVDYIAAMEMIVAQNYAVVIVDSVSHEWNGPGGCLSRVDASTGNKHAAWKPVTQDHLAFVNEILWYPTHLILCGREKETTAQEKDDRGRNQVVKLGMQLEQRGGFDYEVQIHARFDMDHTLRVDKTRCTVVDSQTYQDATDNRFISVVWQWLNSGEAQADPQHFQRLIKTILGQWLVSAQAAGWVGEDPNERERKLLRSVVGDLYTELMASQDDDEIKDIQARGLALIEAHKPSGV